MTPPLVLELALAALTDREVLPVLGDAVLESGWFDERVHQLVVRDRHVSGAKNYRRFMRQASKPTPDWGRAVLAVALFGGWSETRWPVRRLTPRLGTTTDLLRRLYPEARLSELLYQRSPLFGINRHGAETRLAGQRYTGASSALVRELTREVNKVTEAVRRDLGTQFYGPTGGDDE